MDHLCPHNNLLLQTNLEVVAQLQGQDIKRLNGPDLGPTTTGTKTIIVEKDTEVGSLVLTTYYNVSC